MSEANDLLKLIISNPHGAIHQEMVKEGLSVKRCSICRAMKAEGLPIPGEPDPEKNAIADAATERDILATAAREEGWRVNKDTEEWFAEKPCHNAGVEDVPDTNIWRRCYTHEEKFHCPCCCNGTLFVRAGKIKKEMEEPNAK
jgi:hypothetical protein